MTKTNPKEPDYEFIIWIISDDDASALYYDASADFWVSDIKQASRFSYFEDAVIKARELQSTHDSKLIFIINTGTCKITII